MTTKTMSVEDAEKQLDSARQKLNLLEGRLRSGQATLEEHVSAQQFVRFAEDVLKNVRARIEDEDRQRTEEARREKARIDHNALVEGYGSSLTELVGEHSNVFRAMVSLLTTYNMHNERQREAHRGIDWRALDEIAPVTGVNRSQQDLKGPDALIALMQRAIASTGQTSPLRSYEMTHGKFPDHIDAIERQRDTITGKATTPNNGKVST